MKRTRGWGPFFSARNHLFTQFFSLCIFIFNIITLSKNVELLFLYIYININHNLGKKQNWLSFTRLYFHFKIYRLNMLSLSQSVY